MNALSKEFYDQRFITFSLGSEVYAIPLLSIKEVIAVPEITPMPHTPSHFLGIMNLRGQIISVVDLRLKLNLKPKVHSENAVIIYDLGDTNLGVLVDSVNAVIKPKENEISEPPALENNPFSDFISAVYRQEENLILMLDMSKTLR